ncbi:unnamed protein product [Lasius platythorax]|uniref:Uncharacterized protein n=1 Tax=Lasius platythorax TaxID=488582 RepID=A0AAV2P5N0_9HYME
MRQEKLVKASERTRYSEEGSIGRILQHGIRVRKCGPEGQQRRITSRSFNRDSMDSESPLKKTRARRVENIACSAPRSLSRPRAPASSRDNKSIVISRKLHIHVSNLNLRSYLERISQFHSDTRPSGR